MHCHTRSCVLQFTYIWRKKFKFTSSEKLLRNLLIFPSFPLGCFPETLMLASLSQDFQQTYKLAISCWIEHWRYKWQWAKNSFGQLIIFDEAFLEDKAHFKGRYIHNLRTQRRYFHMEFLCCSKTYFCCKIRMVRCTSVEAAESLYVILILDWVSSHPISSHLEPPHLFVP